MKCFYYLSPTLASTTQVSNDLHNAGIKDFYIHVISRDESGLKQQHVHSSNYLETLDVIRVGFIGAFLGFVAGLIGVELLRFFEPFGPGLIGVATENKKLERFHDDLVAGRYLILIYAHKELEDKVRAMMAERHREAEFAGEDRYFLNPFSRLTRGSEPARRDTKALQKS
jgi:hypothetical protein